MLQPTQQEFLAALAKTEQLVPAPRTLGRALQLLRNPESGLDEIAALIRCDPALAVDVLRCANSAFFSRTERTTDVSDAVQVVGFGETIRLVSLVATRQATDRNLGSYGIAAEDFWAESLFNGLFLEALARRVAGVDAGEAYTAGLLRFVGRLALDQALRNFGGGLFWDGRTPLPDWERENVGLTQAEVGAQLLRKWEFPEGIVLAVAAQDLASPDEVGATEPLVPAMQFTTRILPAGTSLAAIEALAESAANTPPPSPPALGPQLTGQAVAEMLHEAHEAFVSIRETLYR